MFEAKQNTQSLCQIHLSELSSITQNGLGLYRSRFSLPAASSWANAVGTQNEGKHWPVRRHSRTLTPCFPAFPTYWLIIKDIMGPPGSKKRTSASPIDKDKAIPAGSWELRVHSCFSNPHPSYWEGQYLQ